MTRSPCSVVGRTNAAPSRLLGERATRAIGYVAVTLIPAGRGMTRTRRLALAMALSLDPLPRHLSLGRSFGLAIGIGFGYWLAFGLSSSLGHSGLLPAWFAAWSPNALFAMMAGGLFLFGEER